jgi:hypothetical protein
VIVTQLARAGTSTPGVDQNVWSLRNLGFVADPFNVVTLNDAPSDPLVGYDVVFSPTNWPASPPNPLFPTARQRIADHLARGGGFITVGTGGVAMLRAIGHTDLAATSNSGGGFGYSGIINWSNSGGPGSVVTGVYPALDTAIVDPPTWFTAVPGTMTVDGSLPLNPFLAGLAPFDWTAAAGRPVIAHGTTTASNAGRLVLFANPLYRADPEREWPMLASAAYWVDE